MAQNMLTNSKDVYQEADHLTWNGCKQTLTNFLPAPLHCFKNLLVVQTLNVWEHRTAKLFLMFGTWFSDHTLKHVDVLNLYGKFRPKRASRDIEELQLHEVLS